MHKEWNERTLEEKKESFRNHIGYEITQAIVKKTAPFLEERNFENADLRAYNPSNGIAYNNLNSLMLDIKQKEGNYKSNAWISLSDAKFLGANEKEIEFIRANTQSQNNPNGILRARISYIKESELKYVKKLDENGQLIPLLDENGQQKISKYGELLFENETTPQLDEKGNVKFKDDGTPFMDFKTERVEIEPTLVVESLYNIENFKTINPERLKPLNEKTVYRHITKHKEDFDKTKSNLILEDLQKVIYPETIKTISKYFYAQNLKGKYTPSITQTQAQQAQEQVKVQQTQQEQAQTNTNTNKNKNNKGRK